jgi:calcyclin binding protein
MVSIMEVEEVTPSPSITTAATNTMTTTTPMIEEISSTTTINETTMETVEGYNEAKKVLEPWEEKILDAQEILSIASSSDSVTATTIMQSLRPTTRMHLEALGKRLQKEGEALRRISTTNHTSSSSTSTSKSASTITTAIMTTQQQSESYMSQQSVTVTLPSSVKYMPIDRFAFDAGGYNEPFVTLYIDMPNVGTVRDAVSCQFTKSSFDLIISNLQNKSYRLYKDNLEKEIDPEKSKHIVKANKVIIKLHKIKTSEFGGYDYWTKLSDPKKSNKLGNNNINATSKKDDPSSSIMDMMKQMYDEGDDNMKKIIGETMMKQRNGELNNDKDNKFGKMGTGMDDLDRDDM